LTVEAISLRVPSPLQASIRTAIARTGAAALAAALIFGAATAAQAETAVSADQTVAAPAVAADQASPAPAPASSPAGQTNPGPGSNPTGPNPSGGPPQAPPAPRPATRPAPAPAPLSHLPVIDFVATFTQPAYYGNRNPPGGVVPNASPINNYDPIDLGGTVRIPVTRKLNLLFDRITEGTLNQPLECVIIAGGPPNTRTCPAVSRDILLQYHATYAFDRFVTMDVGDSFRHRVFNSGASGVSAVPFPFTVSSTEHHFAYLGVSYAAKPMKELLNTTFIFSITGDAENVDHHVAVLCSAGNRALGANCAGLANNQVGYIDQNPRQSVYYETTQGVTALVPLDIRHGTTLTLNERWGALNFYENAAFNGGISAPYRWNSALTYQLNKRFSPGMTLALRHSDFHAIPQGAPFPVPNAIHVGSWDIIGTFHVDTNTFFH
jgi:hypothetical protein